MKWVYENSGERRRIDTESAFRRFRQVTLRATCWIEGIRLGCRRCEWRRSQLGLKRTQGRTRPDAELSMREASDSK